MLWGPDGKQARAAGRAERRFWVYDHDADKLVEVSGFSTQEDRAWWVPSLGYTLWEDGSLFTTKLAAKNAALEKLRDEVADRLARIARLEREEA